MGKSSQVGNTKMGDKVDDCELCALPRGGLVGPQVWAGGGAERGGQPGQGSKLLIGIWFFARPLVLDAARVNAMPVFVPQHVETGEGQRLFLATDALQLG